MRAMRRKWSPQKTLATKWFLVEKQRGETWGLSRACFATIGSKQEPAAVDGAKNVVHRVEDTSCAVQISCRQVALPYLALSGRNAFEIRAVLRSQTLIASEKRRI